MNHDQDKSRALSESNDEQRRDEAIKRMIASLQGGVDADERAKTDDSDAPPDDVATSEQSPNEQLPADVIESNTSVSIPDEKSADADENNLSDAGAEDKTTPIGMVSDGVTEPISPPLPQNDANKNVPLSQDKAHDEGGKADTVGDETQSILPIDSTPKVVDSQAIVERQQGVMVSTISAPWTLQQFFNGEIDLDVELTRRFPSMPMMSLIKFRALGTRQERSVATLSSQDGSATVTLDADKTTKIVQMSFTVNSMLTLRFALKDLSEMDRSRWLELMKREQGGLAFLWGSARWTQDYTICIARKYHTNLYAFSPSNFEAAVRLTPDVTHKLLSWLEDIWADDALDDDEPPHLLTW